MIWRLGHFALVGAALAAGCSGGRDSLYRRLYAESPRVQTAAIAEVIRTGDRQMAGTLVPLLQSDYEGVRFMAATGIHRLAGDCLDSCYPELRKRGAVAERLRALREEDSSKLEDQSSRLMDTSSKPADAGSKPKEAGSQ